LSARTLAEFAATNDAARVILNGPASSAQAARKIIELGFKISAPTVRGYRQAQALTAGKLTNPQPIGRGISKDWQPRLDLGADEGSFATVPRAPTGAMPDDKELLELMGLDADKWAVAADSIRVSRWQVANRDGEPYWLEAYKGHVRPRSAVLDPAEVERILAGYPKQRGAAVSSNVVVDEHILLIALADMQVGKPDAGGTEQLVQTFRRCVAQVAERIRDTPEHRVGTLLVAQLGDCVEGTVSQGGRLRTDISLTEAIRVTRRLLLHAIGELAPLCDRMLIASVAGNHDETRRDQQTKPTDSWSLEVASGVADALAMSDAYKHVQFAFPAEGELSLAVRAGDGLTVGLTHGHVCGSAPTSVPGWWRGQALGGQAVGQPACRIILTGHWHHLRIQAVGNGRYWIQAPALESGSDWYRNKSGDDSVSGLLSVELCPGMKVPWKDLRIHS
jgi:hypothetical protein